MSLRVILLVAASSLGAQTFHNFDIAAGPARDSGNLSSDGGLNLGTAFLVEYLLVGGGGGGGGGSYNPATGGGGGGGGGGAVVTGSISISEDIYTVMVGAGGAAGSRAISPAWAGSSGGAGGASSAFGITSAGGSGGYGGSLNDAGYTDDAAALRGGASGSGFAGGVRGGTEGWQDGAPGGGGAGGVGGNGNGRAAGAGGLGLASSLSGSSVTYGGGGAGHTNWMGTWASGGTGGGGDSGAAGSSGLGGGGGGGFGADVYDYVLDGGAGGSGVVIVRYKGEAVATGGSIAAGAGDAAGYTVHTFSSVGAASLSFAGLDLASRQRVEHDGVVSGSGTVNISTPGVIRLSGANTYTGGTTVSAGTLEFTSLIDGETSNLGAGAGASGFIALAGGTLRYLGSGAATTSRYLWIDQGDGVVDVVEATAHLAFLSAEGDLSRGFRKEGAGKLTLARGFSSASAVTVAGGTLELTGDSSNTGSLTVTDGILLVNGSTSAQSLVSVSTAGTLGGSGTVGGDVTVAGTHSPGNSPGIQTIGGNLTYSGNASVIWELAANTETNSPLAFDQVVVGGDLAFADTTTLQIVLDWTGSTVDWADAFWESNRSWLLYEVAGTVGGFENLQIANAAFTDASGALLGEVRSGAGFFLSEDASGVRINYAAPVPEPSTYGLLLGGLALAVAAVRRRRTSRV